MKLHTNKDIYAAHCAKHMFKDAISQKIISEIYGLCDRIELGARDEISTDIASIRESINKALTVEIGHNDFFVHKNKMSIGEIQSDVLGLASAEF